MDDLTDQLMRARHLAKDAMDSALACAQAFEDLFVAASRLLEQHEIGTRTVGGTPARAADPLKTFSAESPPKLTHAEFVNATIDGEAVEEKTWNGALRAAVSRAARVARSPEERMRLFTRVRAIKWGPGNREGEKGYKYLPDVDISLQGRDAIKVWEGMLGVARQGSFPIEVVFRWPHREGVAFPGETGRLVYDPSKSPAVDIQI